MEEKRNGHISVGFGPARISASGEDVSNQKWTFTSIAILLLVVGAFIYIASSCVKSWFSVWTHRKNNQSDVDKKRALIELRDATKHNVNDVQTDHSAWIAAFHAKYKKIPIAPPLLQDMLDGCPPGYEEAMLLHMLSMLGSMCFSKVRAEYLDHKKMAPNILVIIEGGFGQGKDKFKQQLNQYFKPFIDESAQKVNSNLAHPIVQHLGLNISHSKLASVLKDNKGVHFYMFTSEIDRVRQIIKEHKGISYELIRLAFENGTIDCHNMSKDSVQGQYPVYCNFTFCGTPGAIKSFINGNIENGTASRFCWTVIPKAGKRIPNFDYPKGKKLNDIHSQIKQWRDKYCYARDPRGKDCVVNETVIDLGYINEALEDWLDKQYDIAQEEKNECREVFRTRVGNIAFNCAIVLHMLYDDGAPDECEKCLVQDLTIYIANYVMEQVIERFGEKKHSLCFRSSSDTLDNPGWPMDKPSYEEAKKMYDIYYKEKPNGGNWCGLKKLAKMFNLPDKNYVKRAFIQLEKTGEGDKWGTIWRFCN